MDFIIFTILLIVGTSFLILELSTPGVGVFGMIGVITVIASAILMFVTFPFHVALLMLVLEAIAMIALGYVMFRCLKKSQSYGKLILNETLEFEKQEVGDLEYFLSKEGMAKTPLKPVGMVDFNGVVMEVTSNGSFIAANRLVKVIAVNDNKITVIEQNEN